MELCSLLQPRYIAYMATDGNYEVWWEVLQNFLEKIAGDNQVSPRLEAIAYEADPGPWLVLEGERALLESMAGFHSRPGDQGALRFKLLPEDPSDEWFREEVKG